MREHFCTYFDHRYAARGLAMWRSLNRARPLATLHVLCLSETCREILTGLQLPYVHLHSLSALEDTDPALLLARGNRSLVEYYFTLTPCLPLYIFNTCPEVQRLTYVDADLFFFANPQPALDEMGDNAVGLIEHRFPDELADLGQYGRFNVGWLTFRRDPIAIRCLDTWREQCIAWCYDRLEGERFAEQKYLDAWPDRFDGIHVLQHRGANVAPWNLNRFEIALHGDELRVGGQRMLFFHVHGFLPQGPGQPRVRNLEQYHVKETPLLLRAIFEPYEKALVDATTEIALPLALAITSERSGESLEALKAHLAASQAAMAARLCAIHALQAQLETNEAAHGDVVRALQQQLAANESETAGLWTELLQARSHVDAMERSLTWRWTRAARLAARWLGK